MEDKVMYRVVSIWKDAFLQLFKGNIVLALEKSSNLKKLLLKKFKLKKFL